MMEGEIPSDLWCLSLLQFLDASENHIHCIPVGITQLSNLETLLMNHCPMLEEIAELPSSLTRIEAHGCPSLETETSSSLFLWSLLERFKSKFQVSFSWHNYYFLFFYFFLHEIYMTFFCSNAILLFQEVVEYQSG